MYYLRVVKLQVFCKRDVQNIRQSFRCPVLRNAIHSLQFACHYSAPPHKQRTPTVTKLPPESALKSSETKTKPASPLYGYSSILGKQQKQQAQEEQLQKTGNREAEKRGHHRTSVGCICRALSALRTTKLQVHMSM